jgi:Tol biopolymer transport system component
MMHKRGFEMIIEQMDSGVAPRLEQRRSGLRRKRPVRAFAVAAAIGLVAVACTPGARGGRDAATPADEPATEAPEVISGPFFLDLQTGEKTPLPENLAGGYNYVASPDGTRLAFGTCCSGADVITVANVDGGDPHTLESPQGLNYYGARWSPDGSKLVYQERDGGADDALTGDVGNLFVHDLSSGRRTQITDLELSRAWWYFLAPSFTPDGRDVIFHLPRGRSETTKFDVWSVPVTGGEPTLVLRNGSFPMMGADLPNDVRIAFLSPYPDDLAGDSIMAARLLSPPDSDLHQTLVEANESIWWPTLSPDGGGIAYQDGGSIYVVLFGEAGLSPEFSKVTDGEIAEWLDNDTLIVVPS